MKNNRILESIIAAEYWAMDLRAFEAVLQIVSRDVEFVDPMIFHGAQDGMKETAQAEDGEGRPYQFGSRSGNIGIIRVEGPIVPRPGMEARSQPRLTTALELQHDFAVMEADSRIDKIALVIDSPGGTVTGIQELASQIRASSKPTAAYVFGHGASAAYWIASAADRVVANPTASIGSVGVIGTIRRHRDEDSMEIVSTQSPKKSVYGEDEGAREHYQEMIDDLASVFVNTVADNRETTADDVLQNYGKGAVLIAEKAFKSGMIDGISTFSDFMRQFSEEPMALCGGAKRTRKRKNEFDNRSSSALTMEQGEAVAKDTEKPIETAEKTAEKKAEERTEKMNLLEHLATNAEHRAEFERALAEAETKAATATRIECQKAAQFMSGAYPEKVKALALGVISGSADMTRLEVLVDLFDAHAESEKTTEVAKLTEQTKTPTDAPTTGRSSDGKLRSWEDMLASAAENKGVK